MCMAMQCNAFVCLVCMPCSMCKMVLRICCCWFMWLPYRCVDVHCSSRARTRRLTLVQNFIPTTTARRVFSNTHRWRMHACMCFNVLAAIAAAAGGMPCSNHIARDPGTAACKNATTVVRAERTLQCIILHICTHSTRTHSHTVFIFIAALRWCGALPAAAAA